MTSLAVLDVSQNAGLYGTIPTSLGALPSLQRLDTSGNRGLVGDPGTVLRNALALTTLCAQPNLPCCEYPLQGRLAGVLQGGFVDARFG